MSVTNVKINNVLGIRYIDPYDYDHTENEEYIDSRIRFTDLTVALHAMKKMTDSDFANLGNKFVINARNKDDAYVAAIAFNHVYAEKTSSVEKPIFFFKMKKTDESLNVAFDKIDPKISGALLNPNRSVIYDLDELTVLPTEDTHGLQFYISTIDKEPNVSVYDIAVSIFIDKDIGLIPQNMLRELFEEKGFDVSLVDSRIDRLGKLLTGKDEYTMARAVQKVIDDHLFTRPYDHVLVSEDFDEVLVNQQPASAKPLQRLIGLEEEMKSLSAIICEHYVNRQRVQLGLTDQYDGANIVFAGPPGTAKTTLARRYAGSLTELGIISAGNFCECVKSDIIGQYVGQTTPKIDKMFRDMANAGGGVLFFDEIYTLSEHESTVFDKEAVTAIVQNMENFRGKVFCVFAGYEDKMNEFLSCNPGLRSRITNIVKFHEYSDSDLISIFWSIAEHENYKVPDECVPVLRSHFARLREMRGKQFGNGREARNLFVNAKQQHAIRIGITKKATKKQLTNIDYSDVVKASEAVLTSELEASKDMKPIGFLALNCG